MWAILWGLPEELDERGAKGENWDNYNSIVSKIQLKKHPYMPVKYRLFHKVLQTARLKMRKSLASRRPLMCLHY